MRMGLTNYSMIEYTIGPWVCSSIAHLSSALKRTIKSSTYTRINSAVNNQISACFSLRKKSSAWSRLISHGRCPRLRCRLKFTCFNFPSVIVQKVAEMSVDTHFICRAVDSTATLWLRFTNHTDHWHAHDPSHQSRHQQRGETHECHGQTTGSEQRGYSMQIEDSWQQHVLRVYQQVPSKDRKLVLFLVFLRRPFSVMLTSCCNQGRSAWFVLPPVEYC
jgi:hypothetical protein